MLDLFFLGGGTFRYVDGQGGDGFSYSMLKRVSEYFVGSQQGCTAEISAINRRVTLSTLSVLGNVTFLVRRFFPKLGFFANH